MNRFQFIDVYLARCSVRHYVQKAYVIILLKPQTTVSAMRILFIFLVMFLFNFCCHAQSDPIRQSSLQIMGGAVNSRMVDTGLSFNRQAFIGTSFKFFGGYDRRRNRNLLLASFEINGGKLTMHGEPVSTHIDNGQIAASYLFKTASYKILGKKGTLFIGPKISTAINYVEAPKLDNETLLAIHGLYLHTFQQIQLSASDFMDIGIALPTVAFSKRLVLDGGLYEPEDDDLMNVLVDDAVFSLGKMFEFNAGWSKRLTPHTYITIRYRFAYLANTEFGDLKFYSNEVLGGFRFYFRNE